MRRRAQAVFVVLLLVAMVLAFAGAGDRSASSQTRPASITPPATQTVTVIDPGELRVRCPGHLGEVTPGDPYLLSCSGPSPTTTTVAPTTTTTVPGSIFRLFGPTSLWNTVKDPSDFATQANSVIKSISFGLNNGAYDHPFYIAKTTDPVTTFHLGAGWGHSAETITANAPAGMSQASGSDAVMTVLLADGTLLDMYGVSGGGTNWTAEYYGTSDGINGTGFGNPPYAAIGTTAIGSPQAAGTILASNVASGVIPHALTMACDYGYLGGATTGAGDQVAPAVSNDDGGGGGPLPEGGLLFIPPGTSKPSGLSTMGTQLWDAASIYGAYITDQAGGGCYFYGDGSSAVGNAFTATDLNAVGHALELVVTWVSAPTEKIQPPQG